MEVYASNFLEDSENQNGRKRRKKKRSGAIHVIRVALHLLRRKKPKSVHTVGIWRRLVMSVLPLKPSDITTVPQPEKITIPSAEDHRRHRIELLSQHEEFFTPPASLIPSSATSACGQRSYYGSAQNLAELGCCDDEDEDDGDGGGGGDEGGDEMIDVKAEEFIAKFYSQMKMQARAYSDRYTARTVLMGS